MAGKRGSECLLKPVSNIDFNPIGILRAGIGAIGIIAYIFDQDNFSDIHQSPSPKKDYIILNPINH